MILIFNQFFNYIYMIINIINNNNNVGAGSSRPISVGRKTRQTTGRKTRPLQGYKSKCRCQPAIL